MEMNWRCCMAGNGRQSEQMTISQKSDQRVRGMSDQRVRGMFSHAQKNPNQNKRKPKSLSLVWLFLLLSGSSQHCLSWIETLSSVSGDRESTWRGKERAFPPFHFIGEKEGRSKKKKGLPWVSELLLSCCGAFWKWCWERSVFPFCSMGKPLCYFSLSSLHALTPTVYCAV